MVGGPSSFLCACLTRASTRSPPSQAIMNTPKRSKTVLQKNPVLEECSQTSIEDLSKDDLIDILSFLPTTDAVKTTAVAPPWRNLWHSVPALDFDMFSFHSNIPDRSLREARDLFIEFINQTLTHRPCDISLRKFKLWFCCRNSVRIQSCVHSWLKTVIGCKVAEIDLRFQCQRLWHKSGNLIEEFNEAVDVYSFYSPLFLGLSNSSVEVLKMKFVDLRIPVEAFSWKFDSIKEVKLTNFTSSEQDIERLVAVCINLERLSLVGCWGFKNLKIVSKKLKRFKLFHCNVFNTDICAPNLESIKLGYVVAVIFSLMKTPSLVEAKVRFVHRNPSDFYFWTNVVSSLSGLQRLTVQYAWPWYLSQPRESVFSDTFVFHNLNHLELWTEFAVEDIGGLAVVFERSPQLKSVVLVSHVNGISFLLDACLLPSSLDKNYKIDGKMRGKVKFFLPCLKLVELKDYGGSKK